MVLPLALWVGPRVRAVWVRPMLVCCYGEPRVRKICGVKTTGSTSEIVCKTKVLNAMRWDNAAVVTCECCDMWLPCS